MVWLGPDIRFLLSNVWRALLLGLHYTAVPGAAATTGGGAGISGCGRVLLPPFKLLTLAKSPLPGLSAEVVPSAVDLRSRPIETLRGRGLGLVGDLGSSESPGFATEMSSGSLLYSSE